MSDSLYAGACLRLNLLENGIAELLLDRQDGPVNKLDAALLAELDAALRRLRTQPDLRGLLLASAKDAFLAGADIAVLWDMLTWPQARLLEFVGGMQRSLGALAELSVPVACAINGYALGGGLELALCADHRVLAADAQAGFPEVGLGILPGAGGTVRTPRLAGVAVALEWIVGARNYKAPAALTASMVDAVAEPAQLRAAALQWLQAAAAGEHEWQGARERQTGSFAADEPTFEAARAQARKAARHQPAALAVVDLLQQCAPLPREQALALEAQAFTRLIGTPAAHALVGSFLAGQQLKKKTRHQAAASRPVRQAGVLGAGIMGGGIAYASAVKGVPVRLKDVAQKALDLGTGEARKLLDKQVENGKLAPQKAEAILAAIVPQLDFTGYDGLDLVIEAVVENLGVKQAVFAELEAHTRPGTVLASNTSSLRIGNIAAGLQRPQDVVGMHFFNPVPLMPLVEIVRGERSRDEAVATAVSYTLAMGKTPLVVKDCAGFLINRLLGAYFVAFLLLIRDGADFVQIDRVMESWGWPMGPSYLLDVAGLDTLDKALVILAEAYPEVMGTDFETAIQRLAGEKRYGQKTGAGFFRYEADARGKPKRSGDPLTHELLATVQPQGRREFADEEILERMMLAMVLEAARCLEEEVAGSALEIDAGMRLGTGFPLHHGGPLWYADAIGLPALVQRCARYRPLGGLYQPGAALARMAAAGDRFYTSFKP
ncbi:MAG TPA: 3-hydroxyacyl-CoA dehydrogenase NAD-binding domain-containing protein [Nevskia sp.]|nr:3-hydroxyacyl-CoA dehydrogenase NAD-binding domain-containing protein [Nevskia sp.]